MKITRRSVLSMVVVALIFASCTNDDDNTAAKENITILPYETPATYDFNRNENSSVDVADQKSRILMLTEIGTYISSGKDNVLTSEKLTQMYSNTNAQFSTALGDVETSINLKDKTATSIAYFNGGNEETISVQSFFQATFNDAVAASAGTTASAGHAGKVVVGTSTRLFAANGIEPGQVVAKGMMGAHLMDQTLNNFLSKSVLDAGNNRVDNANKELVAGKNYTAMEHAWDQAYGYIYGGGLNTSNKTYFWDSYIQQVNDQNPTAFGTLSKTIKDAFIKGRAAITGNDYKVRDEQIAIIKENFSKIPAIRAVYYLLKEGKPLVVKGVDSFHALSEGYGFIMDLRYTNNPATNKPYFTKAEVDAMMSQLSTGTTVNPGLWDMDNISPKLDAVAAQIAARFNFSLEEASK